MEEITTALRAMADEKYAAFQAKLAPTVDPATCLGVRLPELRRYAKELAGTELKSRFLAELPHGSYDENILHAVLLSAEKDFSVCLGEVERFLPYVDNWAVCDSLRPKCFSRHREELLPHVREWIASEACYTCRFGLDTLMSEYLDKDFSPSHLSLAAGVDSEEYYVRMMVAWYFATALAKQWDSAVPYIENRVLPAWIHRKTIQKAVESFRISDGQKEYLRSFR